MGYLQASTIPVQANSERCLVLRQQYALKILPMLEKSNSHRIINVDESWLNQTRFVCRLWVPTDAADSVSDKQVQLRISQIIALDTEDKMWCALMQANTDADVMTLFLPYLERRLDLETPGWQENSTILLDNAAWHTNPLMKARLARMKLPIIYSGPYSYTSAPVESIFAAVKFGNLNPDRLPTGKK